MKFKYIAIEGPIGVGKTSLAEILAREFDGRTILEDVDNNPFLEKFYGDRKQYAFQTQIFFLLNRFQQHRLLSQQELFKSMIISDYIYAKDRIFAYLNLDENELLLYEQIYKMLDTMVPRPDLVVYLRASGEVLEERIRKRNSPIEANIDSGYVGELVNAYNRYFFNYSDSPLLVVDTSDIDFVNREEDLRDLIREINSMRGGGVRHYIPLGS